MRINKYVALATGISRRAADQAIANKRVAINNNVAQTGQEVLANDVISLDGRALAAPTHSTTIMLNKPLGYVVSREGQGSKTIYELLPPDFQKLKPVGRLDKDSSGLLLLTNDGSVANRLTHPSFQKEKVYEVALNKPLQLKDQQAIEIGIQLEDGISRLRVKQRETTNQKSAEISNPSLLVTMSEGRNRQIRRTFSALGYKVTKLHRTKFGEYALGKLRIGQITITKRAEDQA